MILSFAGCGVVATTALAAPTTPISTGGAAPKLSYIDTSKVPELQGGTLRVGTDVSFPPIEFFASGSTAPQGLDIDLAAALAQVLRVKVTYVNHPSGNLFTDVNAGKCDIIMSGITTTTARTQLVNFIPYFLAGTGIIVPHGNPKNVKTLQDLCGLRVGAQFDTVQVTEAKAISCGENGIQLTVFNKPTSGQALAALEAGTIDAFLEDFPPASFDASQSNSQLQVVPTQFNVRTYGIGLRKTSTALLTALTQALGAIHTNGQYQAILTKWGLQGGAL